MPLPWRRQIICTGCGTARREMKAATQTCSPALWEREIAFVLVFPESFPAFPAAWKKKHEFVKSTAVTTGQHKKRKLYRRNQQQVDIRRQNSRKLSQRQHRAIQENNVGCRFFFFLMQFHTVLYIFQTTNQVDDSYVPCLKSTHDSWRGKSRSLKQQPSATLLPARYKRKIEERVGLQQSGSCSAKPELGNQAASRERSDVSRLDADQHDIFR